MISIRKRWKVYQYCFEAGKVNGKRKQITKSGFRTKSEAFVAGQKAYDEFINGESTTECNMLYSDYLDYWMMLMSIPKCTKKGIYLCTKRGMKLYT